MTPERWKRTEELFYAARALAPGGRSDFLAEACRGDEPLQREVESLLNEPGSDDGFLSTPVLVVPEHMVSAEVPAAMAGRSLGGYQLQTLLGAGGMGEVYRAHDTRLGRDVAIKVLPSAFTSNADRLARFEREARMLAALNHPNICAIYGVDEADGIRLLVLELVEGETLAGRLAKASSLAKGNGLPLHNALDIARQIADALEVAHDKGIVHRDLKPANVKITPDGVVKVLDFGLAKAVSGDGSSPDLTHPPQVTPSDPGRGALIGTAAYMSPEQARGLPVDKRTDIWAFGCVLYEMLTGHVTFPGDTASDSIAKILEREPDWSVLPVTTPASIRRLLLRCLVKDPKRRLRDIGDVRIEIDAIDEVLPGATATLVPLAAARSRTTWLPWVALVVLAVAVGTWEARRATTTPPTVTADPLAATLEEFRNAKFSYVTDWAGTEELAEISPDGNSVAFLADRDGQFDVWAVQVGLGNFDNLTDNRTRGNPPWPTPGSLLRDLGFSDDGLEIWFSSNGNPSGPKLRMPLSGGTPYQFLPPQKAANDAPSWSSFDSELVFFDANTGGDPLFLADRTGAEAHPIVVPDQGKEAFFREGMHNHNPVWSLDGKWIYFVRGTDPFGTMDVWRVRPSGDMPEQLTDQGAPVSYLTPLDARTLLYVARAEDWSGPWLWALDVDSRVTRRVTVGQEIYTSVSASRNGRVVATGARPTANLWRVPVDSDRPAEERDAKRYDVQTVRALAPRFPLSGGTLLFYLSLAGHGTGDGLFRFQDHKAFEVRKGAADILSEPPVPSPDGSRVAVVVRQQRRKRRLAIMSADGTGFRVLAPSIDIQGVVGQGTADWSPDGKWIVTGGNSDVQGQGLFMIPVDGGEPVRLVEGPAQGPVWSPKGDLIVYAIALKGIPGGRMVLRGVRPDRSPVEMPEVQVRVGGAHRFLPNGTGLVYLEGIETKDFKLVNLVTRTVRPLTSLSDRGYLNTFDITPDGKYLVFDRSRQNSDVVLIDLKRPAK